MGLLGPILNTKLIPVVVFFTAAIAGLMNYWSIKNSTKWLPSNLNIQFALKSVHIALKITHGLLYTHGSCFYSKTVTFESTRKNWKLPQNTNMFFQTMSDFYTLIKGLLAHSWLEIIKLKQSFIISAFWHWKIAG